MHERHTCQKQLMQMMMGSIFIVILICFIYIKINQIQLKGEDVLIYDCTIAFLSFLLVMSVSLATMRDSKVK